MTDYNYIEIPRMNMKSSIFAEFVERIKELEKENEQLKKFCEEFNALNVSKENQRLKELLKECKEYIDGIDWNVDNSEFFAKIDEVLK